MPHSQRRRPAPTQQLPTERIEDTQNDDDNSLSTIPREIFIRKRTDASSTCKTSGTGSSGSGSSRSSNATRGRLRFSFFARRLTQLLGAFPSKDRRERRKPPRVAHEEDNEHRVIGGPTDISKGINQDRLRDEAPEATVEASPPPPSYDEALRLGLFKRPS